MLYSNSMLGPHDAACASCTLDSTVGASHLLMEQLIFIFYASLT